MNVGHGATSPVAVKDNGVVSSQPSAVEEAIEVMSALGTSLVDGISRGEKLHEVVAAAMFLDPGGVKVQIKSRKLRKFSGEFAAARRFIASMETDQSDAPADAKRKLTNFYNNASRNATYVVHHLRTLSSVQQGSFRKNPSQLKTLIGQLKLGELKTAYERARGNGRGGQLARHCSCPAGAAQSTIGQRDPGLPGV